MLDYFKGNWIRQVSCNTKENVFLQSGYLILQAEYKKYNQFNYTGGQITTRVNFPHGRYEVRASQPMGLHLRTSIHTSNQKQAYWHELGQLDMASNIQEPVIYRGVHFGNSTDSYEARDLLLKDLPTDLHEFHLYGAEWNESHVKFFFDNVYSDPILLNKWNRALVPGVHIRLQIGVGLEFFKQKIPDDFERLQWKCPAFIVDYVRVYERIHSVEKLQSCKKDLSVSPAIEEERIQKICKQVLDKSLSSVDGRRLRRGTPRLTISEI